MLVSHQHGKIGVPKCKGMEGDTKGKCDFTTVKMAGEDHMPARSKADRFGYMFAGAPDIGEDREAFYKLGRVGEAMIGNGLLGPSRLPSIITFFGQFIDHDVTANTDREPEDGKGVPLEDLTIDRTNLKRNDRSKVVKSLGNLRRGTLRLDSVYGDNTDWDKYLRQGAEMRIGKTTKGRPFDLPRFGQDFVGKPSEIPDFSDLRSDFGDIVPDKIAMIGDGRNDENLLVAQMHLAFLRLHNALAANLPAGEPAPGGLFGKAKKLTQWHYQWLIVNAYLPVLCDSTVLAAVVKNNASIYSKFASGNGRFDNDRAPIPLEFSVAAFRHGHSMIRERYKYNETANGNGIITTAIDIFEQIGRGGLRGNSTLDDDWVIDWSNFLDAESSNRSADHIDTAISPGLDDLINEPRPYLRNLAQRNLRRAYVLNIPHAQDVLAELDKLWKTKGFKRYDLNIEPIKPDDFRSIKGGQQLIDEGYHESTPLWFYILAESEIVTKGKSLGPLGSLIVAETLVGLIVNDTESYWGTPGSDTTTGTCADGRWHPGDFRPEAPIDSFEAMLEFAGVM
ncbi:MAG: peroxidase family protein [Novosphingobium sp.]